MSSGLQAAAVFAGSLPGSILISLGQALVVVCVCFDMVRAVSVPRSHRRYLANSAFLALAWPSILISAAVVLLDAVRGDWQKVAAGVFVLVAVIFRWHHAGDEDSWWKGMGKALGRWLRRQTAVRSFRPAFAAGAAAAS
jgi:predicted membrane channel-forming protein YqfA (hemolysin III family)